MNFSTKLCNIYLLLNICCLISLKAQRPALSDIDDIDGNLLQVFMGSLNGNLQRVTSTDEPQENFRTLLGWYEGHLAEKEKSTSLQVQAIRLVLALSTINDDNKCTPNAYNIIHECDRALSFKVTQNFHNQDRFNRLEKILAHYLSISVNDCHQAFFEKFDEVIGSLDEEKAHRVELFLDETLKELISDKFGANKSKSLAQKYYNIVDGLVINGAEHDTKYVMEALKRIAKGSPDEAYLSAKKGFKYGTSDMKNLDIMFDKYLVEPCKHYIHHLGSDVFEPATFYAKISHKVDERKPEFYQAWARYKLCLNFVRLQDMVKIFLTT